MTAHTQTGRGLGNLSCHKHQVLLMDDKVKGGKLRVVASRRKKIWRGKKSASGKTLESVSLLENGIDESKDVAADEDETAAAGYQACQVALKGHLSHEGK